MAVQKTHKNGTAAAILQENARKKAIKAQQTANEALDQAEQTASYFWHKNGTGEDAGAHVTEYPRKEWTDPEDPHYHSGANLLMVGDSILLRQALAVLVGILQSGLEVFEPEDDENPVLTALTEGMTIGKSTGYHITVDNGAIVFWDGATELFSINVGDSPMGSNTPSILASSTYSKSYFYEKVSDTHSGIGIETDNTQYSYNKGGSAYAESRSNSGLAGIEASYGENIAAIEVAADENGTEADISTDVLTINNDTLFKTFTATGTVTLNAGSGDNVSLTGTVPDDYTPIAIQSIESEHNRTVLIGKFSLTSTGASVTLRNVGGDNYTNMTVSATILCTAVQ